MREKASADFPFDAEPERTLHTRPRQAKRGRLAAYEGEQIIRDKEEEEVSVNSEYSASDTETIPETMAADPPPPVERLLGDYEGNNLPAGRMTIVNQPVNAAQFQLHPSTINQLERRSFSGRVNEDENKHLQQFLTMSTTLKIDGHTEEEKRLRMFPFTLTDEAEEWFYSLPAGSITTWEEMETAFLKEYFPALVSLRKIYDIMAFKQKEGEVLGEAYKRFKRLLMAYPTHNMNANAQMQMFINGLRLKTRQILDSAAGGSSNFAIASGMKKIIEAVAANEHLELYDRVANKPEGVVDFNMETNKHVKIEEKVATEVEKRLKALNIGVQKVAHVQQTPSEACEICNGPHITVQCLATPHQMEEIKFLKKNNPYSNSYNPGWKNHPNFAWRDQKGNTNAQAPGGLPSATIANPRDNHILKAILTRSGKTVGNVEEEEIEDEGLLEVDLEIRDDLKQTEPIVVAPLVDEKKKKSEPQQKIVLPCPQRAKKKDLTEKKFEKFLELFKKLEINIPFAEALEQMPIYAKLMKDIISKKRSISTEPILLTETFSAILQGLKILIKKKDRGAVTIPCTIGDRSFKKALIDLCASVSLMPLSIYKKLELGEVQDTRMTLQFADHSMKRPYGIATDVLVKIDKFVFPVDFVVLEMLEDEEIPLILGRPFLETGRCMIDIEEGTMTLKVYDKELKINVRDAMKFIDEDGTSKSVEVLDTVFIQYVENKMLELPLESVLSLSIFENGSKTDVEKSEVLGMLEAQPQWKRSKPYRWEELRPSQPIEEKQETKKGTELKQLPENLKYIFLDSEEKCLAIINSGLKEIQEEKLIKIEGDHEVKLQSEVKKMEKN
ncbi:uncharacterized protein LOC131630022 [Vicia villosa]|uniref:uncharacterized protein LOC131630022 n=1 Tax=Vicia villosa TaxID=3911 RepID=UPI00273C0564|nr:uncharacterized protein LOC131630022 [Vicia villosa]